MSKTVSRLVFSPVRQAAMGAAMGLVGVALLIGGCAQTASISATDGATSGSATMPSAFAQFPDIPVPPGSKINVDKTLVFGSKPWFGQLTLESSTSANRAFDFFRTNLGAHGWQEVTFVRAPTSILTYTADDRVLAIAIRSATIIGSELTLTVSPRGKPQGLQGGNLPPPVIRQ